MNVHRGTELAGKGTPTHFVQVMLPQTIAAMKLQIPRLFAAIYWKKLSDVITIAVENGRKWRVRLERVGQDMYLEDGWDQFVQFYSIKVGYFVVFKFKGKSSFEVSIFDLSTIGVCYDQPKQGMVDDDDDEEEEDEDEDIQFLVSGSVKNKKSTEKPKRDHVNELSKGKAKENGADVSRAAAMEKIAKKMEAAMIAASAYTPTTPSFMEHLRAYNVQQYSFMTVPLPFAKTYFNLKPEVISLGHDGREWQVKCNYHRVGEMKLGKGWNKFIADNQLVLGDVCVFQLVRGAMNMFQVTFFRLG